MNSFLLLNAMAPSAKRLDHLKNVQLVHPERLYCELVDLISSVSIFEDSDLVSKIPPYQHKQLTHVFGTLDILLSKLLEGVVPKKMAGLKLEKVSNAIYQVATIDSAIFDNNDFYLAVYFESEDTKWIDTFSDQVKVGATEKLEIMIASALAGVQLTHCLWVWISCSDILVQAHMYILFRLLPSRKPTLTSAIPTNNWLTAHL